MDTVIDWIGLVGGLAGLAILGAGTLAIAKGSYSRARIEALREDNEDLRKRVGDMEGDIERWREKDDINEQRITALSRENEMLTALVTQRANVDELATLMREHHREAMVVWNELKDAVLNGRN